MGLFGTRDLFAGAVAWLNSKPLSLESLRGKVVLADFWTYSCVNCLHSVPGIIALHKKYAKKGLVVIGVHTPEFEFEKDIDNIKAAIKKLSITYPIAVDSAYNIWRAFSNSYWPRQYLISQEGKIVFDWIGEGGEAALEKRICELLDLPVPATEKTAGRSKVESLSITHETYLGSYRSKGFGSGATCRPDGCHYFVDQGGDQDDLVYLDGGWEQDKEYISKTGESESRIRIKYTARECNVVFEPGEKKATLTIELDGKPIKAIDAGDDVKAGKVIVDEPRMYRLVKTTKFGTHELVIKTSSQEVRAFAFTFS